MSQKTYTKVASSALATAIRFSPCYDTLKVGTDTDGNRIELVKEKFAKDFINISYIVIITPMNVFQASVYVWGPSTTAKYAAEEFVRGMAAEMSIMLENVA